ncbi:LPS assembly lipoprotein LptE [Roseibium sp.]|uniref:LPS assembly lipoprotein LptE n=1 Tax=Roseibium sp. TaxID=1936156 RepID=UPI003B51EC15
MSLFDRFIKSDRGFRTLVLAGLLAFGFTAGGCQIRPLYGTAGTAGSGSAVVSDEMAAIDIASIGTDVPARTLYNELTFNFERGTSAPAKKYRLVVLKDTSTASVAVEQFSDVPSAYTLTMNASFVLSDLATEKTLMTGRSFQSASFDFSNQRFANLRASRDAEERVAKAVAEDITARIAGYFATHQGS